MVLAVSCSSTPAPSSFPLSSAGWMVLKALEKSNNMTTSAPRLLQVREGSVQQIDEDLCRESATPGEGGDSIMRGLVEDVGVGEVVGLELNLF